MTKEIKPGKLYINYDNVILCMMNVEEQYNTCTYIEIETGTIYSSWLNHEQEGLREIKLNCNGWCDEEPDYDKAG